MFGFRRKRQTIPPNSIVAAASGTIIPLERVQDEAFAQKMMGDGVAIEPDDDHIVAPCDGTVTMLYPTLHAFSIKTKEELDVLVHIGIDTVGLKGKGFKSFVSQGAQVKAGDKIISVDLYDLKRKGIDMTTMILFPNCTRKLEIRQEGMARQGKTVVVSYEEGEQK